MFERLFPTNVRWICSNWFIESAVRRGRRFLNACSSLKWMSPLRYDHENNSTDMFRSYFYVNLIIFHASRVILHRKFSGVSKVVPWVQCSILSYRAGNTLKRKLLTWRTRFLLSEPSTFSLSSAMIFGSLERHWVSWNRSKKWKKVRAASFHCSLLFYAGVRLGKSAVGSFSAD